MWWVIIGGVGRGAKYKFHPSSVIKQSIVIVYKAVKQIFQSFGDAELHDTDGALKKRERADKRSKSSLKLKAK